MRRAIVIALLACACEPAAEYVAHETSFEEVDPSDDPSQRPCLNAQARIDARNIACGLASEQAAPLDVCTDADARFLQALARCYEGIACDGSTPSSEPDLWSCVALARDES